MSTFLIALLSRTPFWVWIVLAVLVAFGLRQARDHVVTRRRAVVQPLALGLFSLWGAASAFGLHAAVEGPWLLGLLMGLAANQLAALPRRVQALPGGRFAIGGSWLPMVLLLGVFFMRYAVNVSIAVVPALSAHAGFAAVASLLYGLPAGLLAARAMRILASAAPAAPMQAA